MATTKRGRSAGSAASSAQVKKLMSGSFGTTNTKVADAMSEAIAGMGVSIPMPVDESLIAKVTAGTTHPIRRLSNADVILMTLMSNPNKWFLVCTAKIRRRDLGIYGFGECIEMVTHQNKDGEWEHYARFNGKQLNERGQERVRIIRERVAGLRGVVESGSLTPFSLPTTGKSARKKQGTKKGSLAHAAMYPLTEDEATFIDVIVRNPNKEILVASNVIDNESWFSFRWKWSARYGFDMSQIKVRQSKAGNETYNIYVTYAPGASGEMKASLAKLVEFLEAKRNRHAKSSTKTARFENSPVVMPFEPVKEAPFTSPRVIS